MIFRQLFDVQSSTYTYLLGDLSSKKAIIIDPVFEQTNRDSALIEELGLTLQYSIDTHCHADHVTASWLLKQRFGCQIGSAAVIQAENTDLHFTQGDVITVGDITLEVRATPGHTDGCLTYVCHSAKLAFTGDTLLIRGCGRCDFQQGSASRLFASIKKQIFTLPDDYTLYPAHDYSGRTSTSVLEEKNHNPRIGGLASESDFVGYMQNMTLPHPKFIDIALPANLKSGKTDTDLNLPTWAPLTLTYAGIYEVSPQWVVCSMENIQLVDVRELDEVTMQRVEGAIVIPLAELKDKYQTLDKSTPVVALCRSGKRSALAVNMLKQNGFEKVANVKGGLLNWEFAGLPISH